MVFDECHHTRKNHPYNCILREYFQVHPSSLRPKIFGMTASPIWNTKNPMTSLAELEANMDAKVIAIREHVNELAEHSPKPSEVEHSFTTQRALIPYLIRIFPGYQGIRIPAPGICKLPISDFTPGFVHYR